MSTSLLQKTLKLDEEDDGIKTKKAGRAKRQTLVQMEKEMLKQNGQFYYLDLDTGELTKKNERGRAAVRQQKQELLSINEAKQGYSLVDQFRDRRPKNTELRNQKYLELIARTKIDDGIIKRVTERETVASLQRQRRREEKKDVRGLIRKGPIKKKKEESKSIFSELDFAQVGSGNKIMDNFKRIK